MARGRMPELIDAFDVPAPPVQLNFDQLALWNRGLVVLTARQIPAALHELHAALSQRLLRVALPVESRPFVPHITLARKADASVLSSIVARDLPEVKWRSAGHVLVESAGGRYNVLARY
ncbi:2'-5' RNA ligase family protein [Variovorax paradoxus]|nr:2'-5' RNA ligase family protein [Variovorax paradoxus]